MSYHEQLTTEINELLNELSEAGQIWVPSWIAMELCRRHDGAVADGDDGDFWRHCGYVEAHDQVRRAINRRAGDKTEDPAEQLTFAMPGYQYLQRHYVVPRDGQNVGVPTPLLTDEELQAKRDMHRGLGDAHHAHADEIERYLESRAASRAA